MENQAITWALDGASSLCIPIISLLLAALLSYKYVNIGLITSRKRNTRPKHLPPGPTPIPVLGCLFQMVKNKPTFRWIHRLMDDMNTEIACIRLGKTHVIAVKSPELAREFLKAQDAIFCSRPLCMTGRLASQGYISAILSPVGDQWKKMRRVVSTQIVSQARHRLFHDKRMEEADHLIRYVFNRSELNEEVNVRTATQHYCGNVIRRLVFNKRFFGKLGGTKDGGPGADEEEHVGGVFTILTHLYGFSIADYFPWLEVLDFDGYKRIMETAIRNVTKYHDREIDERVQMWKNGVKEKEDDILDVLINLKDDSNGCQLLTKDEIKAQVLEIVLASVDNPSNAIEWAIGEMINQPDIFRRAQEELDRVVGRDRLVQESDLSKLNFVKACAREAFRLHPVAPFNVPHVSIEDTYVSGYFIPKGSHVLLSRPGLGRNPRVWKEPLKYIPDRHIHECGSETILSDPKLRLISFSTGRRGCVGVLLGSTMTTMLLARLIHGFTWSTAPNDKPTVDLVESERDMLLAKPLLAHAKPKLNAHVYKQL